MPQRSILNRWLHGLARRRLRHIAEAAHGEQAAVISFTDAALAERFLTTGFPSHSTLARSLGLACEAARRTLRLKAHPVQLMGAAALFDGVIAEMKTGEGKTLVIALTAALAALSRRGVHVAVPNAYLAQRDAAAMKPFFDLLGLSVGVSLPGLPIAEKQAAYAADVTYAVHSELGFDYLRDHLVARVADRVHRGLAFAIVDEADAILIDEARTPLVVSHSAEDDSATVRLAHAAALELQLGVDVELDLVQRTATLTEKGLDRIGEYFVSRRIVRTVQALYEPANLYLMRYLSAALRALHVFRRDRDYLVKDGQVHIIDSLTGRVLSGRRWQNGLHPAIEQKEGLAIQPEMQTAAQITYQSFFGRYTHLAGLSGTILDASEEFETLYRKPVVCIPTHRPVVRRDFTDRLCANRAEKFCSIVQEVVERHARGQPVLLGTGSVEESEALSHWLQWAGVRHRVLNARQTAQEAEIIADAGRPGAVTVTTNMAGRGTDIVLGGRETAVSDPTRAQVVDAGGLHVIGTQRSVSSRVDDQLRGRAGRQGDPGSSQFYLSMDDELSRLFSDQERRRLERVLGAGAHAQKRGVRVGRVIRETQQRFELVQLAARQQLAAMESVRDRQRETIYALRTRLLENVIEPSYAEAVLAAAAGRVIDAYVCETIPAESWELVTLEATLSEAFGVELPVFREENLEALSAEGLRARILEEVVADYRSARGLCTARARLTEGERLAVLTALDRAWRAQLEHLDLLQEGIHLRSYAQESPVHAFSRAARAAFEAARREYEDVAAGYLTSLGTAHPGCEHAVTGSSEGWVVSRNGNCPCGSLRRFKHCHGRVNG